MLRPFKYVVTAVALEERNGELVGERISDPITFYGSDKLQAWIADFEQQLSEDGDTGGESVR